MKILIIGFLGHIGKPLAEYLVQEEHDITVISRSHDKNKPAKMGSVKLTDFAREFAVVYNQKGGGDILKNQNN